MAGDGRERVERRRWADNGKKKCEERGKKRKKGVQQGKAEEADGRDREGDGE
jgi:hypothetical protein